MTTEPTGFVFNYGNRIERQNRKGKKHRIGAPAVVYKDGLEEYWIDGVKQDDAAPDAVGSGSKAST